VAAEGAAGVIVAQDLRGNVVAELGPLPEVCQTVEVTLPRTQGTLRLAAVGEMTLADGNARAFTIRSRPFAFAATQ